MTDLSNVDTNDILDMTLDDLEDLPTFEPYPAGAHRVLVTLEEKTINDNKNVEVTFKLQEHMELADPTKAKPLKEGAETSLLCGLGNEWGRGELKKIATPIGQALGLSSIRDVIEQANDIECVVVTYLQQDKNDKELYRTKVKSIAVV